MFQSKNLEYWKARIGNDEAIALTEFLKLAYKKEICSKGKDFMFPHYESLETQKKFEADRTKLKKIRRAKK